jgi:UDP-glucuronate 4-epimerase
MKVLITGCAGFIGFSFANYLLQKNIKVTGIDNFDKYYSLKLKKKRIFTLKHSKFFEFKKLDLTNRDKINKFFKKKNFDYVFHFAAQAGVRFSMNSPEKYIDSNILGFFNLLNSLKKFKKTKIFYSSSSSVYGDSKVYPVNESSKLNPKNFYGLSKMMNEEIASMFVKNFNMKLAGLRFFTVFGEWGRPDMLLIKFFNYADKKKTFLVNNSGNHYRDFTYIKDVNKILFELLKKFNFKKHEIFNVCSGKPYKLYSVIKILSNISNYEKFIKVPFQKVEVLKTFGDNKKIIKITGKIKFTNIYIAIQNTYDWFKKYKKLI